MMLASPFFPAPMFSQHNSNDSAHYRPSKDMDAFNSLLPPPIEFVEGSSSGTLAMAEGKYEPINCSPKLSKAELHNAPKSSSPASTPKAVATSSRPPGAKSVSLHPAAIDMSWPQTCSIGSGLYNSGNTCFLNSALQCLIHTPPLLKLIISHKKEDCHVKSGFCMSCSLRTVIVKAHSSQSTFSPASITNNLQIIAKHMRKGRQEDTHEFLRYAIDALQKSCLAGYPPKLDSKHQETTWVHKLFGGRLRSRVTCRDCGHNSDTFDRILDLSLDIFRCDSLRDALHKFIAIDFLKGADKYKCEQCKKHVNAEKRFTIHEAPLVLTVHLKRFTPLGRKIPHLLQYDEELSLQPYMSAGQFGPMYSLYGVICHAGGGPNSGHYYAFVKSKPGDWFEMNDEVVSGTSLPADKKNAYILFYIQNKGQALEAAVKTPFRSRQTSSAGMIRNGLAAGMKKKVQIHRDEEVEDKGVKVSSFIGPLLPSPEIMTNGITSLTPGSPSRIDPQAISLKSKIEAVAKTNARIALESLGNYDSEDSDNKDTLVQPEDGMDVDVKGMQKDDGKPIPVAERHSSPPVMVTSTTTQTTIPPSSFYGSIKNKKRKFADVGSDKISRKASTPVQARTKGYIISNPFNNVNSSAKRKRMGI